MKIMGLGIGILIFAVLFQLCSSGMDFVSLGIGIIGLVCTAFGAIRKADR